MTNLTELIGGWLREHRPHAHWRIEHTSTFSIITGYGFWFGIYGDYITCGYGVDRNNGHRYNGNLLLEAGDPEFFTKLGIALDIVAEYFFDKHARHPFETWRKLGIGIEHKAITPSLRTE